MTKKLADVNKEFDEILDGALTHSRRFKRVIGDMKEMEHAIQIALPFHIVEDGETKSIIDRWFRKLEELYEALADISLDNVKIGKLVKSLEDGVEIDD